MKTHIYILVLFLAVAVHGSAQENVPEKAIVLPGRMLGQVGRKIGAVENGLTRQTEKYLKRWLKRETKMRCRLQKANPELAARLFTASADSLKSSLNRLNRPAQALATTAGGYIPAVDSLSTMLGFLQGSSLLKNGTPAQIQAAVNELQQLKGRLQQTENIQQYLKERKAVLMQQLGRLPGFGKQLKKINEDLYYYGQTVREWKSVLSDPKKVEQKALALLNRLPAFQNFMARNSEMARFFPALAGGNITGNPAVLAGLQTRNQVSSLLQTQLATGGSNAQQMMQQQVSNAMAQLNKLKGGDFGNAGSAAEIPDFQPKPMKHKRLISRLEPGFNLQLNKNNRYFPITADVGAQLRYVLGKNAGIGIGGAYKAGLGTGWRNIRLSHNGLALRSFADWRAKGSIWFNAGAELNYATGFTNINELKNYNNWQYSALAGISKKFKVGKKMTGSAMLLYDFLYNRHLPATQPFVYRLTYSFR